MATVACGKKIPEALVMLKSTALFAVSSHIVFHVFTEVASKSWFLEESLIPSVDAVIYLDADVVVMFPIEQLWNMFHKFNSSHLAALVPEFEDPKGGYYLTKSKIPYVLPAGVNSGVMLMNLSRIARSRWTKTMVDYSQSYKPILKLGDQDLINIYFRYHPGRHLLLDCSFNYRTDHCETRDKSPASACRTAEDQGALILHGNRGSFQDYHCMHAVFTAFSQFRLGQNASDLPHMVRDNLKKKRQKKKKATPCDALAPSILQQLVRSVSDLRHRQRQDKRGEDERRGSF